jgi:nuclear protein localization family protein 4
VIFTDLTDVGDGSGKVVCKRHADSYFLSSLEAVFAAEMQNKHPNASRHAPSGFYGSKFITVVLSGEILLFHADDEFLC